ncbi:MAG TPA: CBS domain-containing protein [Gemmatimonadales bacterium]|jgi:stage IV sporulation protein FB|nr:CBS domain-containing protein [Gemmatimonadales bacterium]
MRWSYTIAKLAGTEVKLHVTFLLLVGYIAYVEYRASGAAVALATTLFFLAFFLCILLHEFGHIAMARRFGVRTPDVILLPIGGVARLERIPEEPREELLIALAGPAVTVAIIALLGLAAWLGGHSQFYRGLLADDVPFVVRLLGANLVVLVFNLIPAFPLDGGRVLRALLSKRFGLAQGTRIAGAIGQGFALLLGLYGLFGEQPLALLVAFFIFLGAGSEASAVATRLAGRGLQVRHMMVTDFRTVAVHASLQHAADLLLAGEQREFPVVDNLGRAEGLLTRDDLIRGLSRLGSAARVSEAMTAEAPIVAPDLSFQDAVERLQTSRLPALPVVDPSGKLVGLLTKDNITDLLLVRGAQRPAPLPAETAATQR